MEKEKIDEQQFQFQIRHIQVSEMYLSEQLSIKTLPLEGFLFNIHVEVKAEVERMWAVLTTKIEVRLPDIENMIGSISVLCIYEVKKLAELVVDDGKGGKILPPDIAQLLTVITASTVRGVMYGVFQGTLLHNAILPILDPSKLIQQPVSVEDKKE